MKRVLIANRGEIACRVIRAAHSLGIEAAAVYSDADEAATHVAAADASLRIGPAQAAASYLDQAAILDAAEKLGADAVHPGYGFLAENAGFARAVAERGLTWVGPEPASIEAMGDKERAKSLAEAAGVPVLKGSRRLAPEDLDDLEAQAEATGYPLLVKASAGGGGIGMRRVDSVEQLRKVVESTQSMAARSFGDGTVYLERYIARARHVEIQVFGLGDGRAFHLFERDCSTQRRFQKIIEESPAPGLPADKVAAMAEAARSLAASQNYRGAGTVEFIVDADSGDFFFLEMNTRIQVEHPVTEMVTGVDLVALQLRLARGEDLAGELGNVSKKGAAIECRLYAENPRKMFLPSPGTLDRFDTPTGEHVRFDTGVRAGDAITPFYDPMIAKLVVWGATRDEAIARALEALKATHVEGIVTNRDFLIAALDHPEFREGRVWTGFVDEHRDRLAPKAA
ncbi:acetyl-CoA carboxylase biotin carboxylase subunit [Oceanibacterium hippocampi]|uniref:Biotin carboxylase n=1 Tax=Oceanibacterium hippocampi TaxID=745714 RepID=A0A1Y5SSV2_9PROT|nr:biotin carboxylase N-terminal domain-containing protein [Oceanibacterium hippocampi]SLN47276.1 Biotin carboxylase [Oceanibacterium hippocampi]